MHIHHPAIAAQPIAGNLPANNRAIQEQRAAETRKRLRRFAQSTDAESADPDAILLIGRWLDSAPSHPGEDDDLDHL